MPLNNQTKPIDLFEELCITPVAIVNSLALNNLQGLLYRKIPPSLPIF